MPTRRRDAKDRWMLNQVKDFIDACLAPNRRVMRGYRFSRWLSLRGFAFLAKLIRYRQMRFGCHISELADIHRSTELKHCVGVVIGEGVVISENVKIWQNVTIGSHGKKDVAMSYPRIGAGVRIFAGATIIGGVTVGKNATIGAHSLVLTDVPENGVAVGTPYRPVV